jgi:hypothetical protein
VTITAGLPSRRPSPVALFGGDIPSLLFSDPRKGGDGKTRINPDKLNAGMQWIAANLNQNFPIVLPALGTLQAQLTVGAQEGSSAGDFEASTILMSASAGRVAVTPEVRTPTLNRILTNINLSSNLISGTSQFPGLLPQTIFCLPKTSWFWTLQNLVNAQNSVSPVLYGRRFQECSQAYTDALRRRAEFLRWISPVWYGPKGPDPNYNGPEVLLPPGNTATVTFQVADAADFLMTALLDDSTYVDGTGGGNLELYADVLENVSGRSLINKPAASSNTTLGLGWNKLACTTAQVTGIVGGFIKAFSLRSPQGGYGHIVQRNTQITVRFVSREPVNTIALRPAFFGYSIYAEEAPGRTTSPSNAANRERRDQAGQWLKSVGLTPDSIFQNGGSA